MEAATPAPANWRAWRIWRWLLVVGLAVCAYRSWLRYDFNQAQKEALALGWWWAYDDPVEEVRADWKAPFRRETWTKPRRSLSVLYAAELESHRSLVQRLDPQLLDVQIADRLTDLSVLNGLNALRELRLGYSPSLTNIDALADLPSLTTLRLSSISGWERLGSIKWPRRLESLAIISCSDLTNTDTLRGLVSLKELTIQDCPKLSSLEGIGSLPALEELTISDCGTLTSLHALSGIASLKRLLLTYNPALHSLDGLGGLASLEEVDLRDCDGITDLTALKDIKTLKVMTILTPPLTLIDAIAALQAARPDLKINTGIGYQPEAHAPAAPAGAVRKGGSSGGLRPRLISGSPSDPRSCARKSGG